MKKTFKKLLTASFALALAIGTGVLLGSKSNGEVKEAEAAVDYSKTIRVYVDLNWSGISDVKGQVVDGEWGAYNTTPADLDSGNHGKYYKDGISSTNLSSVGLYFKQDGYTHWHPYSGSQDWNTDYSTINGTFRPGYSYVIKNISFNYGYGNNEHKWFNYTVEEIGKLPVPTVYTVNFYKEDKTLYESLDVVKGTSAAPSKGNPTKSDEGSKQFTFDKWVDADNNDMTDALSSVQKNLDVYASYTESYKAARYITGKFGDCNWDVEHSVLMSYVDNQFVGTIDLKLGDEVKIVWYDGAKFEDSSYVGYSNIISTAEAKFCFSAGDGDNIHCWAAGTYTFYFGFDDKKDNNSISVTYASTNAEILAAKIMSLGEYEGHCGDENRFPAMKAMYLGLEAGEQAKFKEFESSKVNQFKNAYDRYVAWAKALNQNPWGEGTFTPSALSVLGINSSNASTVIIVIVAALLTATVCAGYFFYRKKKQN